MVVTSTAVVTDQVTSKVKLLFMLSLPPLGVSVFVYYYLKPGIISNHLITNILFSVRQF